MISNGPPRDAMAFSSSVRRLHPSLIGLSFSSQSGVVWQHMFQHADTIWLPQFEPLLRPFLFFSLFSFICLVLSSPIQFCSDDDFSQQDRYQKPLGSREGFAITSGHPIPVNVQTEDSWAAMKGTYHPAGALTNFLWTFFLSSSPAESIGIWHDSMTTFM